MSKSDRVIRWINTHQEEVAKYAGRLIAVHPVDGIVDSDEDLVALSARLRERHQIENVVIDSVPPPVECAYCGEPAPYHTPACELWGERSGMLDSRRK